MPLAMTIQVEFFAKAHGARDSLDLGQAKLSTQAGVLVYQPTLTITKGPAAVGFLPQKLYRITAVLQVGAATGPAFITGYLKTATIQTYVL